MKPAISIKSLRDSFQNHLKYSLAKDQYTATRRDFFTSVALSVRDTLVQRWIDTQQTYYYQDVKRVYYLSLEYLMGRSLGNALVNLNIADVTCEAVRQIGNDMENICEMESDAGLGNGGLGRLAACFMDSMATLQLPAYGYGIRYDYGIFYQRIIDGYQTETPDHWLRYGNPWEIERAEYIYFVKFYGRVHQYYDDNGIFRNEWIDAKDVIAMAYDTPVPGYGNNTVNTLRLWSAKSTRDFDLEYFNHGDYERAVADKAYSETISKVLYPNDNVFEGRELRLKQEYFMVSASIQDIVRRYKKNRPQEKLFRDFNDKVAIQLNDTHPAVAIPELMRIFIDQEGLGWEQAWDLCVGTFGYTNHTVLPEALEKWPLSLFERVLPRHTQIIFEINRRFLEDVAKRFPGDTERLRRMSLIEEDHDKKIRMAHLAIAGSHSVNGVSRLHTDIIVRGIFRDFAELWPEKFNNKTNGITPRRWLKLCNPDLSTLITSKIGPGWTSDLSELKRLAPLADDASFRRQWHEIKEANKIGLADHIFETSGIVVDSSSLFDCHVKRIHEYKRQLLNVLHVIALYRRLKADPKADLVPRTVVFAGKAAPGYFMAKLIVKLITSVAQVVNNDRSIDGRLKVVFIENYSVSLAERIIPAADLSEQISTAGTEASGTGNMKFSLNGALTIGTLDGANIEIMEHVGKNNIFIFGMTAENISALRAEGYDPIAVYQRNRELREVIDMVAAGGFSPSNPALFKPIIDSLLYGSDTYMVLADFASFIACQQRVNDAYRDAEQWARMSILNVANMGYFSIDRTTGDYAGEIWKTQPVPIISTNNAKKLR